MLAQQCKNVLKGCPCAANDWFLPILVNVSHSNLLQFQNDLTIYEFE